MRVEETAAEDNMDKRIEKKLKTLMQKKNDKTREERELHAEKDGWKYEGEWLKDKQVREGYGICVNRNGDVLYGGYWKGDKRHFKGREIWLNYGTYEGEFEENKKEGLGVYNYVNGDMYAGRFENELRHG